MARDKGATIVPTARPRARVIGHIIIQARGQCLIIWQPPAMHPTGIITKGPITSTIGAQIIAHRDKKKIEQQVILPSYMCGQPVGLNLP